MAQLKQTVTVTNGSQTVKVIGNNVAYRIKKNAIFMVTPDLVPYVIAQDATFDGANTIVLLAGAYQGATSAAATGNFVTDFTMPDLLPLISQGDVGTAAIWTNTMYKIQDLMAQVSPSGLADAVAEIRADLAAAQASQSAAAASQTAAKTSETNAKTSETNAKTSETNAASSKTAAAGSATAASTSQTAAKTSETNSKTSETNSAASAAAALASQNASKTSETNSKTSETNSAASAAAALASQNAAKTSETNSAGSAAAALASQNAAKTSETNSKTSETNAKTSETNSKTSETNAAASLATVQGILTTMNALYLGNKASAPTVDNSGNPLKQGAEYFDTTKQLLRVYTSTGWQDYDADAQTQAVNATASAAAAAGSASAALASQNAAKTSETNSKTSETNSKTSETNSKTSENNSAASAAAALASQNAAKTSETNSKTSETNAAASAAHADAVAATIGNPVSKNGDTMTGDLWVGDPASTSGETLGTNYRVVIARNAAGYQPYQIITNGQMVLASPPASQSVLGFFQYRWASTTSDVTAGQSAADVYGYANPDGSGTLGLFGRNATGTVTSGRIHVNGSGTVTIGSGNDDASSALWINKSGATLAQAPVINAPSVRITDAGNATSGGLSIESYQPLIQFIDRSTGAKNSRMMQNSGALYFANDPGDNSGVFGLTGFAINPDGYASVGVGATLSNNVGLYVNGTAPGTGTSQYGVYMTQEFNDACTSGGYAFMAQPKVKAATFTMSALTGFYASVPTLGAGATVTNYRGFYAADCNIATNTHGFFSTIAAGTNKWNFYANGTAANYFNGQVLIGSNSTVDTTSKVQITNPTTGHGLTVIRNGQQLQYIAIGTNTGLDTSAPNDHKIVGYSPASAAKPIYIHATTDEAGTTPTNGTVGINFKVLNTTVVKVFQSGNVSVNPAGGAVDDGANALQVGGNIKTSGSVTAQGSGAVGAWFWSDAAKGYFQSYGDTVVGSTSANLLFMANNVEKARLTSAGNLLVGTTTDNGTDRLQVSGTTTLGGNATISGNATVKGSSGTAVNIDSTTANVLNQIIFKNAGSNRWAVQSTAADRFQINRYNTSGALVDTPFAIDTATGATTLTGALTAAAASFSGAVTNPTPALYDNSTNSATTAFVLANALPMRAPLGGSIDLNTITTSGIYHQPTNANASSGTNYPVASAGMLEVYAASSMTYQRYTVYNTGVVYTRAIYNGTPSAWRMSWDSVNVANPMTLDLTETVTGAKTFSNANIAFNGTIWAAGGAIELGSTTATSTPVIDFHSSGTTADYDVRLAASGGSSTAGNGTLTATAAGYVFNVGSSALMTLASTLTTSSFRLKAGSYQPFFRANSGNSTIEFVNSANTAVNLTVYDTGALLARSYVAATGVVYSGGTSGAYLNTNGDIFGTAWGGWLSTVLGTKMPTGGGTITGNTNVLALLTVNTVHATQPAWAGTQGASLGWNDSNGGGEGMLTNNAGSGNSGWVLRTVNQANTVEYGRFVISQSGVGTNGSDIRLKKDIKPIENALDRIRSIRGVEYTYKASGEQHYGVIAQEVKPVLPHAVTESHTSPDGEENFLGVAYTDLVGPLIEAVKTLADKLDSALARIATLEGAAA